MVSQFISPDKVRLLSDIDFSFPEGTHAIGRLDSESEGLLLLTTDKKVTKLLFQGRQPHTRTYLVQVDKMVSDEKVSLLSNGVPMQVAEGKLYQTMPCKVLRIQDPNALYLHTATHYDAEPHTWLSITLTEGKYHQVRKMIKHIKHRVRRLIRVAIEDIQLGALPAGEVKEVSKTFFYQALKL